MTRITKAELAIQNVDLKVENEKLLRTISRQDVDLSENHQKVKVLEDEVSLQVAQLKKQDEELRQLRDQLYKFKYPVSLEAVHKEPFPGCPESGGCTCSHIRHTPAPGCSKTMLPKKEWSFASTMDYLMDVCEVNPACTRKFAALVKSKAEEMTTDQQIGLCKRIESIFEYAQKVAKIENYNARNKSIEELRLKLNDLLGGPRNEYGLGLSLPKRLSPVELLHAKREQEWHEDQRPIQLEERMSNVRNTFYPFFPGNLFNVGECNACMEALFLLDEWEIRAKSEEEQKKFLRELILKECKK